MLPLLVPTSGGDSQRPIVPRRSSSTAATPLRRAPSSVGDGHGQAADWAAIWGRHADAVAAVVAVVVDGGDPYPLGVERPTPSFLQ